MKYIFIIYSLDVINIVVFFYTFDQSWKFWLKTTLGIDLFRYRESNKKVEPVPCETGCFVGQASPNESYAQSKQKLFL